MTVSADIKQALLDAIAWQESLAAAQRGDDVLDHRGNARRIASTE